MHSSSRLFAGVCHGSKAVLGLQSSPPEGKGDAKGMWGTSMSWAAVMLPFGGKLSFVSCGCSITWWWYPAAGAQKLALQGLGRFPINGGGQACLLAPRAGSKEFWEGRSEWHLGGLPTSWLLLLAWKCQQGCSAAPLCKVSVSRTVWEVLLGLRLLSSACAADFLKESFIYSVPDGLCDFLSGTTNNWQYYSAFSIRMWKLGGFAEQKKWECNDKHLSSWTVCSSLEQCWSVLKPGTINLGLSLLAGFIQELNWSFKLAGERLFLTIPCSHSCSCALPCTWSDLCEVKGVLTSRPRACPRCLFCLFTCL